MNFYLVPFFQLVEVNMPTSIEIDETDSCRRILEDFQIENLPDQLIRGEYSIFCNSEDQLDHICSDYCTEQNVRKALTSLIIITYQVFKPRNWLMYYC